MFLKFHIFDVPYIRLDEVTCAWWYFELAFRAVEVGECLVEFA